MLDHVVDIVKLLKKLPNFSKAIVLFYIYTFTYFSITGWTLFSGQLVTGAYLFPQGGQPCRGQMLLVWEILGNLKHEPRLVICMGKPWGMVGWAHKLSGAESHEIARVVQIV